MEIYIRSIKTERDRIGETERDGEGETERKVRGEKKQKRKLNRSKDKEDTSEMSYLIQSWIVTSRQLHRVTSGLLSGFRCKFLSGCTVSGGMKSMRQFMLK